jgi:hypothetical protein
MYDQVLTGFCKYNFFVLLFPFCYLAASKNIKPNRMNCAKFITIVCIQFLMAVSSIAQVKEPVLALKKETRPILLKAENWDYKPQTVEFVGYKSKPAMRLLTSYDYAVLKDLNFTDGIIEFDIELSDPRFASVYFRWNNPKESECFYFRTGCADRPPSTDAIQYAPIIDGVNLWDMLPHYQTHAAFKRDEWTHVKLVVSGKEMRAYVNDMQNAALEVPMLEGNVPAGTLAFQGKAIISGLIIMSNDAEGLSPAPGPDPTCYDPCYIRKWHVSEPLSVAKETDFSETYKPRPDTKWEDIWAERRGLVNLTRKFGGTGGKRIVWLKTTVYSDKVQDKMLKLGFSDEVWVYSNEKPVYMDKNLYNTPMAKRPDGRCSLDNAYIKIPLSEGKNQILVGVSNYFYGWGIIACVDDLKGIILEE